MELTKLVYSLHIAVNQLVKYNVKSLAYKIPFYSTRYGIIFIWKLSNGMASGFYDFDFTEDPRWIIFILY